MNLEQNNFGKEIDEDFTSEAQEKYPSPENMTEEELFDFLIESEELFQRQIDKIISEIIVRFDGGNGPIDIDMLEDLLNKIKDEKIKINLSLIIKKYKNSLENPEKKEE